MPDAKLSGSVATPTSAVSMTTKSTSSAGSQPLLMTSATSVTSSSTASARQLQRSRSMRSTIGASCGSVTPLRRQVTDDELKRKPRIKSGRSMTSISLAGRTAPTNTPTSAPSTSKLLRNSWNSRSLISSGPGLFTTEPIAKNGTTFSARCNRYVVHCAKKVESEELYLTPTQRSTRDLKRLRLLLDRAHQTIRHRDAEIVRLKNQLALSHPNSERSGSCEQLNVSVASDGAAANGSQTSCYDNAAMTSPATTLPSVADSGNYDCLTCYSGSGGSKESVQTGANTVETDIGCSLESTLINGAGRAELEERLGDDWEASERWIEWEEKHLREEHERQIGELGRQHMAEFQEMKETYNNKIETLLEQLSEANTRYYQLRPQFDTASLRVRELELELSAVQRAAAAKTSSDCQALHGSSQQLGRTAAPTCTSGSAQQIEYGPSTLSSSSLVETEAVRKDGAEEVDDEEVVFTEGVEEIDSSDLSRQMALLGSGALSSVYEKQLSSLIDRQVAGSSCDQSLQMDPVMRLQFLRSAVYHLLTDRVNHAGHVTAIGAVLQFSEQQSRDIELARQERRGSVV